MSFFNLPAIFCIFLIINGVRALQFALELPHDGGIIGGDIDKLDQIRDASVHGAIATPRVREWGNTHLRTVINHHPELRSFHLNQITSPRDSLDYLEDMIQTGDAEAQRFVISLFNVAGMKLQLYPCPYNL